ANIVTAMQYGITRFDASLGGLGGCPYAPGAAGNVATNDLLYLLKEMDIKTGINEHEINEASIFIQNKLQKKLTSRSLQYEISQRKQKERNEKTSHTQQHPQRKR